MNDQEDERRAEVARVFREHALRIESTAFQEAMRLKPEILSELVEIAARFSDVADMLDDVSSAKAILRTPVTKNDGEPSSNGNGIDG